MSLLCFALICFVENHACVEAAATPSSNGSNHAFIHSMIIATVVLVAFAFVVVVVVVEEDEEADDDAFLGAEAAVAVDAEATAPKYIFPSLPLIVRT